MGDAYLRIAGTAEGRKTAEAKARRIYLAALFRARQQRSVQGMLRTAEAFAALGDREVTEQCLILAERLAEEARDAEARDLIFATPALPFGREGRASVSRAVPHVGRAATVTRRPPLPSLRYEKKR